MRAILTPKNLVILSGVFSLVALLMALASEVFLGLEPCIMCIYQRIPYALIIIVAIIALVSKRYHASVLVMGLLFFINSGIAFYHTGIERKWWVSRVEGCKIPSFSDDPQSILENILSAPTARCDEIPWADPLIGLSMANYNAIICAVAGVICILSLMRVRGR